MDSINRTIPQKWWRNIAVVLIIALTISAIALVITIIDIAYTIKSKTPESMSGLPENWKYAFTFLQPYSTLIILTIGLIGFAFICFVMFIGITFVRADKVKFFGQEFEVTEELKQMRKDLENEIELHESLQENIREIQNLIQQQRITFQEPTLFSYFDYLDKIVATAAFVVRPGRAVRASIWLYNQSQNKMCIVAGYRISHATLSKFVMKKEDKGFAPHILQINRPDQKQEEDLKADSRSGHWQSDPNTKSSTTSILGQPIQIGSYENWKGVLCFSTDRNIKKFRNYAFSVDKDAATLDFFSDIISFAFTLAESTNYKEKPLIEHIFNRYIK